jgi:hypothetical protein
MSVAAGQRGAPEIQRGRRLLQLAIALIIGLDLIGSIGSIASGGPTQLPQRVGRFLVTLLLCWALWRGHQWSRWLIVVLASVGVLLVPVMVFNPLRERFDVGGLVVLVMVIVAIAIVGSLLSRDVRAFMASQRARVMGSGAAAA